MCGKGAVRSGVGLCSFLVPDELVPILQTACYEVMCLPRTREAVTEVPFTAVIAGPGLGNHEEDREVLEALIRETTMPLLLDADGLNDLLRFDLLDDLADTDRPKVLTPHEGEAARLLGVSAPFTDREEAARRLSVLTNSVVVLKGHETLVADPEGEVFMNRTGNAGLATGGTGDVLSGIIGSLMAQGHDAFSAAIIGVYIHGQAADNLRATIGERGMIASDLPDEGAHVLMRYK